VLKRLVFGLTHRCGVNAAVRHTLRRRLLTLCYHSVLPDAEIGTSHVYRNTVGVDELRQQLEINVTGQIAVTQALLPLLRRARTSRPDDPAAGRIVFMSSVAGRSALPFMGAYAASKFALEAAADALRLELAPFRLAVILIEPGVIATPIWETSRARAERNIERMPPELTRHYGPALNALRERAGMGGLPPERVADVVARALAARRPRARYVVGRDARIRILIQQLLPDAVRDRLVGAALRRFTRTD
jgi:NAD(P)-dependent dehydrogenase (short-subunit alcohol dehydrogenase family)